MPSRVLDVGTDELAVEASSANAQRNGVGSRFTAIHGSADEAPDKAYPLIVANLVAALLVRLAPSLAARMAPGGVLIASGIIETRAAEVIDAMREAGLAIERRRDDGEWVSLLVARAR